MAHIKREIAVIAFQKAQFLKMQKKEVQFWCLKIPKQIQEKLLCQ